MLNLDQNKLAEVAQSALAKTDNVRWQNAIAKAVTELETNAYITWQADNHSLLILSQSSGEIYTANGTCQCKAFAKGQPCYHRAAARLIQRYFETA